LKDFLKAFEDIMYFERFADSEGFLQRINPLIKLVSFTAIILSSVTIRSIAPLTIPLIAVILLCRLSKIPLGYFVKRVTFFIPIFAGVIASPLLFVTSGTSLAQIGSEPFVLHLTMEGFQKAALFTFRIWICVATLNLLILTTKFSQILRAMNRLRVPKLFITMTATTYRFIFLFINEAYRMILAKESRTAKKESRLKSLRSLASMFATLFIRAYEKGERTYLAMLARDFNPGARSLNDNDLRIRDWLFLAASLVICMVTLSTDLLRLVGQ